MNRRTALRWLALPTILILTGCISITSDKSFVKRSDKVQKITLRTRGEAGQHFLAKLNIDGVSREMSGVSPAEYKLDVCVMTGTIRKTNGEGTLRFEILEGGSMLGFGALEDPGQSCKFRYHANGIEVWN